MISCLVVAAVASRAEARVASYAKATSEARVSNLRSPWHRMGEEVSQSHQQEQQDIQGRRHPNAAQLAAEVTELDLHSVAISPDHQGADTDNEKRADPIDKDQSETREASTTLVDVGLLFGTDSPYDQNAGSKAFQGLHIGYERNPTPNATPTPDASGSDSEQHNGFILERCSRPRRLQDRVMDANCTAFNAPGAIHTGG